MWWFLRTWEAASASRAGNFPEYAMLLIAARRLNRPVRWRASRSEAFLSDDHGQRQSTRLRGLALDSGGRFSCARIRQPGESRRLSGRPRPNPAIGNLGGLSGMYRIPAISARVRGVFTNTQPLSPYRGAGRPEATYAIERLLELAAGRTL